MVQHLNGGLNHSEIFFTYRNSYKRLVTRSVCSVNAKRDVDVDATIPLRFTTTFTMQGGRRQAHLVRVNACKSWLAVDERKELSGAQTKKGSSLSYGQS